MVLLMLDIHDRQKKEIIEKISLISSCDEKSLVMNPKDLPTIFLFLPRVRKIYSCNLT